MGNPNWMITSNALPKSMTDMFYPIPILTPECITVPTILALPGQGSLPCLPVEIVIAENMGKNGLHRWNKNGLTTITINLQMNTIQKHGVLKELLRMLN